MNVKGLSIEEIMDIDLDTFNKLNESELRHITSRLVSAGNKRIRRLQKNEINSPAIRSLGDEKKFSTKLPKDTSKQQRVNKLRSEFARVRSFLSAETSTIGGYKKFKKRTIKKLAEDLNTTEQVVTENLDIDRLFELLHKAQRMGLVSSYRGSAASVHARNLIADILIHKPDVDENSLFQWLDEQMMEWEEEQLEESNNETEETDI